MQLLSHLEGETEAAGVLLGRETTQPAQQQAQLQAGFAAGWAAAHSSLTDKANPPQQPVAPMPPPQSASPPKPPTEAAPPEPRHDPTVRHDDFRESASDWGERFEPTRLGNTFGASFGASFESPMPTPSAALRKLSDASIVAKQIAADAPTQALFATYAEPLRGLFGRFASKRVAGALLLSENGWLRLTKNVGLSTALVSSKSLRHFAMCTGAADGTLNLAQFLTGLGLCAIYVHRSHGDAWSLREKVLSLLAGFGFEVAAVPAQCVGPRVESFLWRLFDHFSSSSPAAAGRGKGPKSLSNWGWAKLVRELRVSAPPDAHPDVMFGRHATRGRLSFEAFVCAMGDLDRLIANDRGAKASASSSRRQPPLSPRPHNQENAAPLTNVLSEVTSTGFLASTITRDRH
jgi:hypothetical protein